MNNLEHYLDYMIEPKESAPMTESKTPPTEPPLEPESEASPSLLAGVLRRWYIVVLVAFLLCAVGVPAIWYLVEPTYVVTGAIRVAPILENLITGERDQGDISNYQMFMYTQAEMITSNPVLQRVADDLMDKNLAFFENKPNGVGAEIKQKVLKEEPPATPDPLTRLKGAISAGTIVVAPERRTELMKVTMNSPNPQEAKQIVDTFIEAYMAVEVSDSVQGRDRKLNVLENERTALAGEITNRRDNIRRLAEQYGTTDLTSRQDMRVQLVATLLSELTRIETRRINLEAQIKFLESAKEEPMSPEALMKMRNEFIESDPTVASLNAKVLELQREVITGRQRLKPEHPDYKHQEQLLAAFKARLEDEHEDAAKKFDEMVADITTQTHADKLRNARAELEQVRVHEGQLRARLEKEDAQTKDLGRLQLDIQDEQFQLNLAQQTYEKLCQRIQELEMERKRPARIKVAYKADVADTRDKRKKYSAALLFASLFCGSLLAFLRDKADHSLWTPEDVNRHIGIRIIGTTSRSQSIKPSYFTEQVAGEYQTIRANLGLTSADGIPKKLVITSPDVQEGKTTFAINLASSLARSGKKVLLVDGDLRKPDIAYLLDLPKDGNSLAEVLMGAELNDAIYSISSTGLHVLPSYACDGLDIYELVASSVAEQQIRRLARYYDHVIIDTAPVLVFPDALAWAKMTGAVVLTSFAGQTTSQDLKEAKERFEEMYVSVLGTVLTSVPTEYTHYRYGYKHSVHVGRSRKKAKKAAAKLLLPTEDQEEHVKDPKA
jgi:capsular exopolysaccharide synthesis family protein